MDERRFRAYLTDAMKVLIENVANGLGGQTLAKRWIDFYEPEDTRTAEEIAMDVIKHAGLIYTGGGEDDGA